MERDVVVVGAGLAGLTAADVLTRSGADVVVLEARSRVGGRALSTSVGDAAVDLGPSWFWPDEPLVRSLCEGLVVGTFHQHIAGDALFEADGPTVQRLAGNPVDAPASRFTAGAQSLAEALVAQLPTVVHADEPVSAIELTPDGVRVHSRSHAIDARQVIVALPPALAVERIAFTPALPDALHATAQATEVWMSSMVKAVAVYDDAFWRAEGLAGAAISYAGPFREFHDLSGPGGMPPALFAFAPAERLVGMDPGEMGHAFVQQLGRLFGPRALDPVEVQVLDWSREEFTTPSVAQRRSTAHYGSPAFQQPVAGRIHLASTETATAYAGHLEGAIRAGIDAARRVTGELA